VGFGRQQEHIATERWSEYEDLGNSLKPKHLMFDIIDKVTDKFLMALKDIEKEKLREEKTYNKMGPAKVLPNQRLSLQSYTFDRLSNIEVRQMVTLLIEKKVRNEFEL
jgi:Mg2+ and Co2+ transporter CorA